MNTRFLFAALFACLLASATAFADEAKGKLTFLSPADGAVVGVNQKFSVSYEAELGPKGNHLHLYLDDHRLDVLRQTKGSYDVVIGAPGKHAICLEIETSWHFSTGVRQCIGVTAK